MNHPPEHDWQPDPQLLAAYFDGELNDRADVADLRARLETWLSTHPEAVEESDALDKLWLETTPVQPSQRQWSEVLDRIDTQRRRPTSLPIPARARPWFLAGIVAASVLLLLGGIFGATRWLTPNAQNKGPIASELPPQTDEFDVLQVALNNEVTILRIEGADTSAVVIGEMPVSGELDWVDPGDVCISCKCPRVNIRQNPPYRPMVWPREVTTD